MKGFSVLRAARGYSSCGQTISGMSMRLLIWLLLTLCLTHNAAGKDAVVLASFEKPDSVKNWISVNDGVMGGISKGGLERTERKTLLFAGNLSLENNGGFASIRTKPRTMNLAGASAISVKVRGDGRRYWVGLRMARQAGSSSYRAYLPTSKGEFTETLISLSDFKLQAFGRQLAGGPVDPAAITSVGFTIADKKAGPFELEIEYIKAVFEEVKPTATEPSANPLTPAELIELAIDRGVPLFNNVSPGACAAVYEVTCEALRTMPGVSEESRKELAHALTSMRAEKTERQKAWILRYALDRVLARGTEGG